MASVVTICNNAIGKVKGTRIISLADGTTEANLCSDKFDDIRKAVLEDADWSFAAAEIIPGPDASPFSFQYAYSFTLPSDCIRIISVSDNPAPAYKNNIPWKRKQNRVVCDSAVIYIEYIFDITDSTKFSEQFSQAMATRLAAELAIPVAASRQLHDSMWQLYYKQLGEAKNSDSMQGRSDKIKSSWLTTARNK